MKLYRQVTLFRRHKDTCARKGNPYWQKCACPIWMRGVLDGRAVKQAMRLRDWTQAEERKRKWEAPEPEEPKAERRTLADAAKLFIASLEGDGCQRDTVRKYKLLFKRLEDFATARGLRYLTDFTFEELVSFRLSQRPTDERKAKKGVNTRNKMLDRMKAAFSRWHGEGLIQRNPTERLKPEPAPRVKAAPFTAVEQATILSKPQVARYRAFVHVIYHSGIRISDCCFLRPEDFSGNAIVRVNRKNQAEIYVPVPPYLKAELDALPLNAGYYFLIGESENLHTQTDAWRTILNELFKNEVAGFHPHRFRHTRVVEWLAAGLTMEEVSGMIGTSVKVLEKHYASFAPARQEVVKSKLSRLWNQKPKLVKMA